MPDAVEVVLGVGPEVAQGPEVATGVGGALVAVGAAATGRILAQQGQGPARGSSGEEPTTTGAW